MSKRNLVLGLTSIDTFAHDNSIAILNKGKILFAQSEERYSRIKHDGSFPKRTIKAALSYLKLNPSNISTVAVGFPKRNVLSLLRNKYFYEIIPFILNISVNRNIFLFIDFFKIIWLIYKKLLISETGKSFLENKKITFIDHHLAHSASAYYTSGFKKCISIVLDAFGSNEDGRIRSGAVFLCQNGRMTEVMSIPTYASLGLFYQSMTYGIGFTPGDGEGKTMGLAAYGNSQKLYSKLKNYSPSFRKGRWMPAKDWLSGMILTMPKLSYLFRSTSFGRFLKKLISENKKEDVASAAQEILEEELIRLVKFLIKKYPDYENICLSGGLFLNVKANKKIMQQDGVRKIFVHPHAGDGGVSLGAAFMATEEKYLKKIIRQPLFTCGLGESFTSKQILKVLEDYKHQIKYFQKKDIIYYTVEQLTKGKVIGWVQGRAEWGPRALGFRSVLADPRDIKVKGRINEVLKNREWFMPFAPSILEEEGKNYFKNFINSPFMTIVFDVISPYQKLFPAAIHIDKTARPNSVSIQNNPIYYKLLQAWNKKIKLPIILNTSFNRHGLPIVNSPKDAVEHLLMGAVDELIIGNFSVVKTK